MAYRCGQAIIGGAHDPIRCKVSGSVCAHQKMCLMEGRIILTDGALRCPARDGQMPESVKEPEAAPVVQAAAKKPEKKPAVKQSAAKSRRKTT